MESRMRSVVKAVLWNVMGLTVMALVGLATTGSLAVGGLMAVINTSIGFVMYIFYERIWSGIRWGRA